MRTTSDACSGPWSVDHPTWAKTVSLEYPADGRRSPPTVGSVRPRRAASRAAGTLGHGIVVPDGGRAAGPVRFRHCCARPALWPRPRGMTAASRVGAEPMGANRAPTRTTGPSSWPKSSSLMTLATSAPNPANCVAWWATTARRVRATDSRMVVVSRGTRLRRSTASMSIPSGASASAADGASGPSDRRSRR